MNTWQPRCALCGRGAGPSGLCRIHRTAEASRARTDARLEDAAELLDDGVSPEEVARRVGSTVAALEIAFRRRGQPRRDLMAAAQRARRKAA